MSKTPVRRRLLRQVSTPTTRQVRARNLPQPNETVHDSTRGDTRAPERSSLALWERLQVRGAHSSGSSPLGSTAFRFSAPRRRQARLVGLGNLWAERALCETRRAGNVGLAKPAGRSSAISVGLLCLKQNTCNEKEKQQVGQTNKDVSSHSGALYRLPESLPPFQAYYLLRYG